MARILTFHPLFQITEYFCLMFHVSKDLTLCSQMTLAINLGIYISSKTDYYRGFFPSNLLKIFPQAFLPNSATKCMELPLKDTIFMKILTSYQPCTLALAIDSHLARKSLYIFSLFSLS